MSATVASAGTVPGPAKNQLASRALGRRRHRTNMVVKILCVAATVIGLVLLASIVALEFPESPAGSLKLASLLALGFILFVISFIVLAISRLLLRPRSA